MKGPLRKVRRRARPRTRRRTSRGFALLALAGLLLVGSAAALLLGGDRGAGRPGPERALADLARLVAARDALLAYATIYPELYGPTGAGPGHLPCPDTDDAFRLAGPNPPCGRGDVATGRLPLHVTVAATRVGIDVDLGGEPVRYRLATRAANNPARRPFASAGDDASGASTGRDAMAVLASVGRDGAEVSLALRESALRVAAERRVAAWVASRAASPASNEDEPEDVEAGASVGSRPSTDRATGDGIDVLALVTRRVPSSSGEDMLLVDGVPQARHWFAADGWADVFRVTVAPACRDAARECAWRADGSARQAARLEGRGELALPLVELEFAPVDDADPASEAGAGGEASGSGTRP